MLPSFPDINIPAQQAECLGALRSAWQGLEQTDADIAHALTHPLWPDGRTGSLFDGMMPGERTCLVVSDQTRKTCVHRILPLLISTLKRRGFDLKDCFILVATGIHRPPTTEEIRSILGLEAASQFEGRIFSHEPDREDQLSEVGTTRSGHPVRINSLAVKADRLILLGAATYHYHAGFGGGRKSIVPGLAARATIAYNHSLTLDPQADRIRPGVDIGRMIGNPVAEEMLESARFCDPDFIVNTVLTPDGKLAGVFAGDLELAHQAACRLVEIIDRLPIPQAADFVIASAGQAANWIQSHKALFNAHRAIRPGGRIILWAPCPEGLGNDRFRHWVTRPTLKDIYDGLRQHPEVNGQTALSTRARGERALLITTLSKADCQDLRLRTAPDMPAAIRTTLAALAAEGVTRPTYYVMPEALSLAPFPAGQP